MISPCQRLSHNFLCWSIKSFLGVSKLKITTGVDKPPLPSKKNIMNTKLTQQVINQKVWKACDSFRGTIGASDYKDYILTTLFVKYITDVQKDKKASYMEKYNGDVVRVERALSQDTLKPLYVSMNSKMGQNLLLEISHH